VEPEQEKNLQPQNEKNTNKTKMSQRRRNWNRRTEPVLSSNRLSRCCPIYDVVRTSIYSIVSLILLSILKDDTILMTTYGQIVGTDICACQPVTYELILNLSLSCPDSTVVDTIPGILDRACQVESRAQTENITDPFPVTIGSVIVSELDANLLPVSQAVYRGPFVNGEIIQYTSIILTSPDNINADTIPRGFQVVLTGLNLGEETLTNTWVITYENDCGIFPLLQKGEQIGWTIFVSFHIRMVWGSSLPIKSCFFWILGFEQNKTNHIFECFYICFYWLVVGCKIVPVG
jgi:hypothetical protein